MKKNLFIIFLCFYSVYGTAQDKATSNNSSVQPFLFTVTSLSQDVKAWALNYTGSYGERTSGPFGYDGVDQQLAIKGSLGNRFTLFANAAIGVAHSGKMNSAQQAEVMRDLIGGKKALGPRFGLSLGVSRDWDNVKSAFSRITGSFDALKWKAGGSMRFERAFDKSRDGMDLTTSVGLHHKIAGQVYGGFEAVGQDLEGFWDKEEAEGGARLLVGPSINIAKPDSRFSFSACGGPVFYATRSLVAPSSAIRELNTDDGFTVRAMISFNLH